MRTPEKSYFQRSVLHPIPCHGLRVLRYARFISTDPASYYTLGCFGPLQGLGVYITQTPGRIQKVEPATVGSNTAGGIYFLNPPGGLDNALIKSFDHEYLRILVPNTMKSTVFGANNFKYWVLGPSGHCMLLPQDHFGWTLELRRPHLEVDLDLQRAQNHGPVAQNKRE